jgi:hypothetical protein
VGGDWGVVGERRLLEGINHGGHGEHGVEEDVGRYDLMINRKEALIYLKILRVLCVLCG